MNTFNDAWDEMVKRSFPISVTGFGMQELDYVNTALGSEVVKILPSEDWTNNKTHSYFLKFQDDIVFTIAMCSRLQQHLDRISKEMRLP